MAGLLILYAVQIKQQQNPWYVALQGLQRAMKYR